MSKKYEIVVHRQYCKGCGLCVRVCPGGKLRLRDEPDRRGVRPVVADSRTNCTGCRQCVIICPDAAIEMDAVEPANAGEASHEHSEKE
jgi:2-oxoglutarate ferredoxin oxidoreductase subunit delta